MGHFPLIIAAAAALLVAGQGASAQQLASVVPNALAGRLRADGIEQAMGFRMSGPVNCISGAGGSAYHCVATLADSARGGKTAALEIMIFNGGYDFAARDAQIKASVARLGGRWSLDFQPEITLDGEGRKISLKASCHQSRGQRNSPAYCLLSAASNVLIFSQVAPGQASSDRITTSQSGGSDSFDDMGRAGSLASLGAVAVAKAQAAPPDGRKRN
ncbi:MAG: hypothetical protein ABI624_12850 [Casimicrobiaceae bacterium]